MSVDFNKIYLDKSISVNRSNQSALCFVDGKIISKSKYSILNNIEITEEKDILFINFLNSLTLLFILLLCLNFLFI